MPDLWFFAGLAIGIAIAGFAAVGSFARGADSVRRTTWSSELSARRIAFAVHRASRKDTSTAA